MKKLLLIALSLCASSALLLGDEKKPATPAKPTDTAKPIDPAKPADNTDRNKRDRDGSTLTPLDQSNASKDVATTREIRKSLMAKKDLSMTAKNVKIITTADGKVTLRGPVVSDAEKTTIGDIAKRVAGSAPVDNQLEVKAARMP